MGFVRNTIVLRVLASSAVAIAIGACGGESNDGGGTGGAGTGGAPATGGVSSGGAGGQAQTGGARATGGVRNELPEPVCGEKGPSCAAGTKCCGGACVAPAPIVGCGATGCTPCSAPPQFGTVVCGSQGECAVRCNAGFVLQNGACQPLPPNTGGAGNTGGSGSGGSSCTPQLPAAPKYTCEPRVSQPGDCQPYSEISPQLLPPLTYPPGCEVILPRVNPFYCSPQNCFCTADGTSKSVWVCPT